MRFSKYNNPNKKQYRKPAYSRSYCLEKKDELFRLLANAETESAKEMLIKAYNVSIYPTSKN